MAETSPFQNAIDGWILGSAEFADRVRALISPEHRRPQVNKRRRATTLPQAELIQKICDVLALNPDQLSERGSRHPARAIFAYLSRTATDVRLSQLAKQLGLSRPDSVPAQIRRLTDSPPDSELRRQLQVVQNALGFVNRKLHFQIISEKTNKPRLTPPPPHRHTAISTVEKPI